MEKFTKNLVHHLSFLLYNLTIFFILLAWHLIFCAFWSTYSIKNKLLEIAGHVDMNHYLWVRSNSVYRSFDLHSLNWDLKDSFLFMFNVPKTPSLGVSLYLFYASKFLQVLEIIDKEENKLKWQEKHPWQDFSFQLGCPQPPTILFIRTQHQ